MPYGLTSEGFVPKTQGIIEGDIETAMRANVSPTLDLSADQPLGQMKSIVAAAAVELWELADVLYAQLDPNNAEGIVLDGVCAYTGTQREAAKPSTVLASLTLNASASVPAGSLANVTGQPTNTWALLGPADPTTGILLSAGPVTATSGGTYWGLFQATVDGPTICNVGTLTTITNSVTGWTAVNNTVGAVLGSNEESDAALNVRRQEELAASGGSTNDAIRADLLNPAVVAGVIQAIVTSNDNDVTDVNGLPPHSLHVVIWDGFSPAATNAAISQAIWDNKASGVQTVGTTAVTISDSHGDPQIVRFDRATGIRYYVNITVKTDSTFDVTNGPAAVQAALSVYSAAHANLGTTIYALALRAAALNVKGILDVPTFTLGTSPSPSGTANLTFTGTQIASLNSADVTVTVT